MSPRSGSPEEVVADEDAAAEDERAAARYPGARAPDRRRSVDSAGVRIAVHEWGDPDARPVLVTHGGFDFARTLDVFAPLLADAGLRVVAWDQRGHGDSDHTALYSWDADVRDLRAVLDATSREPIAVIGHSKGGGLTTQLAHAAPHRFTHFVNIDGLPTPSHPSPDDPDERTRRFGETLESLLDHRQRVAGRSRRPGSLDDLARRRQAMNPRLPLAWLRYLVTVGARRDADGWRWKVDPVLRFGGVGPWRPEWALGRLPGLAVPMLAIVGLEDEPMGWGATPEQVEPWLPAGTRTAFLEDAGHFVHIERPETVARHVLEFLA